MTAFAGLRRFRIPVTAYTRYRVGPAINSVARKIIPSMRHSPVGPCLVLNRRFQFNSYAMTIITETGFMAHITNVSILKCRRPVIFHEQWCMNISSVVYILVSFVMAGCAIFKVFNFFFRVLFRGQPPRLHHSTG